MDIYIKQNTPYPLIAVLLNNEGGFTTGETVTYEVRKASDNSLVISDSLVSTGSIYTDFITLSDLGDYYILYLTSSEFENGMEKAVVRENTIDDIADTLDAIAIKITKILGLTYSNYRTSDHVFNASNCLTSAKISIYNTASDTESQTNPIAEYTVTYTYDANGKLIGSKITEN